MAYWRTLTRRWRLLNAANFERELAEAKARIHLAAYKVKSEIEWDMHFLTPLDKSWRAEAVALLWGLPVLMLFTPWTHPYAKEFFDELKLFSAHAPEVYLGGWTLILTALVGARGASSYMGGGMGGFMSSFSNAPDDIPMTVAQDVQKAITPADDSIAVPTDPG